MRRKVVITVAGLLAAFALNQAPARAAGELQGQSLRPAADLETGLVSLLTGLLGGQQPAPGRIDGVVVTEDRDERLTVSVSCSADLEGRRLRGELLGPDKKAQREFGSPPVRIEAGSREVAISFDAPEGGTSDAPSESAYLRVSVDGGGPLLSRVYRLGKRWRAGSDAGGGGGSTDVVRVRLRPEALAAALPAQEPVPAAPSPTPAPTTTSGGGFPADVRDHRHGIPTVEVRDHRGDDHRPQVVDHRTPTTAMPTYRPSALPAPIVLTSSQRTALVSRTATIVKTLPQSRGLMVLDPSRFALPPADQGRGARGPGGETFDLLSETDYDDIGLDPAQIANLTVYRDQNAASGYFYFVPRSYHLEWLADQGRYNLATLYLAATGTAAAGEVQMAATLTAGLDSSEVRFANELLQAYCRAHGYASCQLRPMPIDPSRIAVSLAGTLHLFDIPPEKVAPVGLSDVLGELQLAWVTDSVTKENVQLVMERGGINGNVTFAPAAGVTSQPASLVDLQIKLADPASFERPRWRRNEPWRNTTPYPVRLKYLHALLIGPQNRPTLYTWNLGGALVSHGGRVEWDSGAVPSWIDSKATRMWISYGMAEDCADCNQRVLQSITGGVSAVAASQITFHTIKPIADTGAYELAVRVRSRHFDPEGRSVQEKSLVLKADDQDFTLGPIYSQDQGAPDSDGTLFEYFLTVGMPDGTEHKAQQWIASQDLRVLIGRSQIEKALGFVPGASTPAQPPPAPSPQPPAAQP